MTQKEIEIIKAQIAIANAFVIYYQCRIQSGFYKTRIVEHMNDDCEYTQMTEDELLKYEIQTMLRHIQRMDKLTERMMEIESN